jgi:hypothetical protein
MIDGCSVGLMMNHLPAKDSQGWRGRQDLVDAPIFPFLFPLVGS